MPRPLPASRSPPSSSKEDGGDDSTSMSWTVGRTTGRGAGGLVTEMVGIFCDARFPLLSASVVVVVVVGGGIGSSTSARTGMGTSVPDPWLTSTTSTVSVPC